MRWVQLCGSLSILWHCLSLGLEWKLTFSSPVATAEFSKSADILSAALSQHHLAGFERAQLESRHLHWLCSWVECSINADSILLWSFLFFWIFSSGCSLKCWETGAEVSSCYCELVCLSPQLCQLFTPLAALVFGAHTRRAAVSRWAESFIIVLCLSLFLVNFLLSSLHCACMLSRSVVSDSLRSHGLYPARLLCPQDFTGKNTGVGCHFLL